MEHSQILLECLEIHRLLADVQRKVLVQEQKRLPEEKRLPVAAAA